MRSAAGHAGAHHLQQLPQDLQLRGRLSGTDGFGHGRVDGSRSFPIQGEHVSAARGTFHLSADDGEPGQLELVRAPIRPVLCQPRHRGH